MGKTWHDLALASQLEIVKPLSNLSKRSSANIWLNS
jgi:hypothetical protein